MIAEVEVIKKSSTGGISASVGRSTLNGDANPFVELAKGAGVQEVGLSTSRQLTPKSANAPRRS